MHDPNEIKADRQQLLYLLLQAWPRAFKGDMLYRMMLRVQGASYMRKHFERDIAYFLAKEYIEVAHPGVHKHLESHDKYFRLTANGSEVAQQIKDDPALEV